MTLCQIVLVQEVLLHSAHTPPRGLDKSVTLMSGNRCREVGFGIDWAGFDLQYCICTVRHCTCSNG